LRERQAVFLDAREADAAEKVESGVELEDRPISGSHGKEYMRS